MKEHISSVAQSEAEVVQPTDSLQQARGRVSAEVQLRCIFGHLDFDGKLGASSIDFRVSLRASSHRVPIVSLSERMLPSTLPSLLPNMSDR